MRRLLVALAFGAFLTALPWLLRPFFGDRAAILWLPGFFAVSNWFPLGLHGRYAATAKACGCSANVLIWATLFLLLSYSTRIGTNKKLS